ncbi:unnamed protein product [Linum tenue]|uniref:K Homology domain-containing protein n=1 Tax=Linum tenue TaxID=586396 RepID=A0AAV0J9D9_9ROSI|nr:unnamed protein product [Linum tenue]
MAGQRNDYGKRSHSQSDYGGGKRHNPAGDETGELQHGIGSDDTVYRYLCPLRKIGSIIGRGGEIAKQLRAESRSSIRISESIPGFDERIVTIYSSSEATNPFGEDEELVCPAQHALFLVHDRVVAEELGGDGGQVQQKQVTLRMLVPSDQIGCVIGKGGQVIQSIRSETGAQIRILKDEHLPPFALTNDELLQIVGEPAVVKKALLQVATRLHENPSRFQHLLLSTSNNPYQSGGMFAAPNAGVPAMGAYGSYKGGWPSSYPDSRDDGGSASERTERDSGDSVLTTRLLVPRSQVGCLMGKGGSIISEMRSVTRASIRILSEDNLPKIATEEDEMVQVNDLELYMLCFHFLMCLCNFLQHSFIVSFDAVQITGNHDVASNALLQVMLRLKANVFGRDGALSSFPPALPYVPMPLDMSDGLKHGGRDSQTRVHGGYPSSSGTYGDGYANPLVSLSLFYQGEYLLCGYSFFLV